MPLSPNLSNFVTSVATDFKLLAGRIGVLTSLTTTDKTSVVAAVNELKTAIGGAGAQINDAATNSSTAWSGSKVNTTVTNASAATKAEILGGAGAAFDTLSELKALIDAGDATDQASITTLTTALGNRVRFDAAQTLTAGQKVQANSNMGSASLAQIGDPEIDLVAIYTAGKA